MLTPRRHIDDGAGPTGLTPAMRTIAAGLLGLAGLAACGSGSDEDGAAVTTARTDVAMATTTSEAVASTTVPATTVTSPTTAPVTEPPVTEPTTTVPEIEYPIVVEGSTTEPEDQMGSRGEGPNGRRKYYNLKVFDGGLVGEGDAVGWWRIGESSVEGAEVVDFTGELVGMGSGTFTYTDQFATTFEGEFTGSAEIVGTGGTFENLVGTIEFSSSDFGANRSFRATFTPAPTEDGTVVAPPLTAETAAAIADEFAIAFNTGDFDRVAQRLGPAGTWIFIDGTEFDQSSIAEFLGNFDVITDIARTDQRLEGPDGFAFEMFETWSGGDEKTFWFAVSRDEAGVVTITEYNEAPNW
ncbi:hypothetical protein [Ilumatobacter sp.]|uniref:hypothetical protein n=1 Tax=Ilumatobacter sp. TaxID=1967498 RepID=UPI003C40AFE3